jgi:hypothetical protein
VVPQSVSCQIHDSNGSSAGNHTSSTRAALSRGARADTSTAFAVILAGSKLVLVSMSGLDLSNASLEVGKQVTGLQVAHVDTSDLGQSHSAMGADEWGNSRNSGECGEVHVVVGFVFVLWDYWK